MSGNDPLFKVPFIKVHVGGSRDAAGTFVPSQVHDNYLGNVSRRAEPFLTPLGRAHAAFGFRAPRFTGSLDRLTVSEIPEGVMARKLGATLQPGNP